MAAPPPSQTVPRLPTKADFPRSMHLEIIPPAAATTGHRPALNVLLLLHGLGDTEAPFAQLGRALNLPDTVCISLRAPSPVPALLSGSEAPSFHWADDLLFDQRTGELDPADGGFVGAAAALWEGVLTDVLFGKCAFRPRDVFIWGFGQGAVLALHLAAMRPDVELGGVVAVGGRLPASGSSSSASVSASSSALVANRAKTPVVLLGGSRSTQVTRSAVDVLKASFADVEYVKWAKAEDSMPANREEMLPIMRFFARRLRSRVGVPDGAVELT